LFFYTALIFLLPQLLSNLKPELFFMPLEPLDLCYSQNFLFSLPPNQSQFENSHPLKEPVLDLQCIVVKRKHIQLVLSKFPLFAQQVALNHLRRHSLNLGNLPPNTYRLHLSQK
jgi:hypothetical protein